jgi:glycosyltransferase involved in cell wall biosynthesis
MSARRAPRRFSERLGRLLRRSPLGVRVVLRFRRIARAAAREPAPLVVRDANRVGRRAPGRRALLVYLPRAFALPDGDERLLTHQNLLCCRRMAAVLGELGFVVDVADKRDREFGPRRRYELVVSERLDWGGVDRLFPPDAVHVFLATSLSHATHNRNLRRRHELHVARGRPRVPIRRVYGEAMPAVQAADALVGVGNAYTIGTWREAYAGPLHAFDNFAFPGTLSSVPGKNFETARRRFLYFASWSQMQKGLDLLLEIFPRHPELELYVCSPFAQEPEFCAAYEEELTATPNIHAVGWVGAQSPELAELASRCAFVVHPSCSDGQAGAVVQALSAGLVPLVTRESGLDVDGFGETFADDSLAEIERVLLEAAAQPPDILCACARAASARALERHSLAAFEDRWRAIVVSILDGRR